jgi:hypothetical protein
VESNCEAGQSSYCNFIEFDGNWYDPTTGALVAQGADVCDSSGNCGPGYYDQTSGQYVLGSPTATAVTGLTAFQDGADNVEWVNQPNVGNMTGGLVEAGPTMSVSGKIDLSQYTTSQFSYAASMVIGDPVDDKSGTLGIPSAITVRASSGAGGQRWFHHAAVQWCGQHHAERIQLRCHAAHQQQQLCSRGSGCAGSA